jgi:hypothetical protein
MAALAHSLSHSVATVRRKLLRMMDALAETGLRHAHREISRASEISPKAQPAAARKRKTRAKGKAVH